MLVKSRNISVRKNTDDGVQHMGAYAKIDYLNTVIKYWVYAIRNHTERFDVWYKTESVKI